MNEKEAKLIVKRLKQDPFYLIENFLVPTDLDKPIQLYGKQKELIKIFLERHYVIVNSSRQVGKTTSVAALIVWLLTIFPKYKVAVISKDGDHVKDIISDVYNMLLNVIDIFGIKLITDNEYEKKLNNGSRIKGYKIPLSNPRKVGRGIRAGFIYIDEAAFIPYIDQVYTALMPATSKIHQIYESKGYPYGTIITSTPNGTEGIGRWYYEMWTSAINNNSVFVPLIMHWSDTPFYDEEWAKREREKYTQLQWEQEFELKFITSNDSFLETDIALKLQDLLRKPPKTKQKRYNNALMINMYDVIKRDKLYLIGVDTASGEGGSSQQAIVIVEYPTMHVVGTGTTKRPILSFADSIKEFIHDHFKNETGLFDNFVLFIERNFLGEALIDHYKQNYPEIYRRIFSTREQKETKRKKGFGLSANLGQIKKGIQTSNKTRPLIFDALYSYLDEHRDDIINYINSPELAQQLLSLEYSGKNRIQASAGATDDLVMAFAIIIYAYKYLHKDFRKYTTFVQLETTKEEEVIDVLQLYKMRY